MNRLIRVLFANIVVSALLITNNYNIYAVTKGNTSNTYYLSYGSLSTKKDNGYSNGKIIGSDDPHFGWNLGKFYVTDFTDTIKENDGSVTILKTPGDNVTLCFSLEQDIDKLNGNKELKISKDSNGYDKEMGIEKSNFGRGTLIVRYTDYENSTNMPTVYTDYLSGIASSEANTKIQLFEEGDYEITLDYEIVKKGIVSVTNDYYNYKISFKFSLRNGNCMVYPFDIKTKNELANGSITPNGFYLDLAKSRFLNINIKKQILNDGATGLVEDTRFNKVAKDGDKYTDEGIYIITATNPKTGDTTTKKIYVGDNDVLKAYVTNNMTLEEINALINSGASITEDGQITFANNNIETNNDDNMILPDTFSNEKGKNNLQYILIGISSVVLVVVLFIINKIRIVKQKKLKLLQQEQHIKELIKQEKNEGDSEE